MIGNNSFDSCLQNFAVRLSLPEDLIFVWEFIDFINFSRKMFGSQWWNCLFEISSLSEISLNS